MVKTPGSVDRKKRKRRSDKGKRRKKYRGKSTKKKRKKYGRFIPYVPPLEKKRVIKLWFWKEEAMSPEGFKKWRAEIRQNIRRVIYKPIIRIDVSPSMISTKELIEELCEENLYPGIWLMMGFSHGKNSYRVKPVKLARIKIVEHNTGPRAKMIYNFRLYRYWFWNR